MLQRSKTYDQDEWTQSSDSSSIGETVSRFMQLLRRQLPLVAFCILLGCSLAGVYLLTTPKRFSSMAELVIDSRKTQMLQQQNPLGVEAPIDSAMIDSQVEILKSENVALAVIRDLHLKEDTEFVGGSGLTSTIMGLFALGASDAPSDYQMTRAALARFRNMLTVKRRAQSYVIEITFQSQSPDRAANVANAVAEAYIVDSLEAKYQASRRASTWLQDRLNELRAQASAADRAVVDYKAKNNIVDAGGRLLNEQQMSEVSSSLTIARATTAEAQARFDRINEIIQNSKDDALVSDIATVADTLRNEVINKLRSQYLDLAARASNWSQRYGAQHLAVVNLQGQMREIRRSISDELRRIAESYRSDVEIAKSREESVKQSLGSTIGQSNEMNQAQVILRDMESNAQSSRALADNFLQLYMVSVQQQSFPMTEARVITQASPALGSTSPKFLLVVLAAIAGGCFVGFGLAILRDSMDNVFRTSEQIESRVKVPCIGVFPLVLMQEMETTGQVGESNGELARRPHRLAQIFQSKSRIAARKKEAARLHPVVSSAPATGSSLRTFSSTGIMRYVRETPFSRAAECIRSIRMALELSSLNTSNKVIGITSTLPNEGKTTTSSTFAAALASSGVRTLLVDGDLRNPSLTKRLTPDATAGLLELVLGTASLDQVVWKDTVTGLDFLPAVIETRIAHTGDILLSSAMDKVFQALRDKYDRVVLDLSPLLPIVDVRGTGKLVDSYILVVEWGRTTVDMVERAVGEIPAFEDKLIGAVLNKADLKAIARYGAVSGNYYYNRYYKNYGYN